MPEKYSYYNNQHLQIQHLLHTAIKGLSLTYNNDYNSFCHKVTYKNNKITSFGLSIRYTLITLLGLRRLESFGFQFLDTDLLYNKLIDNIDNLSNVGDIGLFFWLSSFYNTHKYKNILERWMYKLRFNEYSEYKNGLTTELSWLLIGLTKLSSSNSTFKNYSIDQIFDTYNSIKCNYNKNGLFGHMKSNTFIGSIRGHIGSFADQVYPIYAFLSFGYYFKNYEAIDIALNCANQICNLQGPLGQWWWHYDTKNNRIFETYPVYSVHQDSMGPMALLAIQNTRQLDVSESIKKSIEWIFGNNEINTTFILDNINFIYRGIRKKKYMSFFHKLHLANYKLSSFKKNEKLYIIHESRPYHLGWIIYTHADKLINREK